MISLAVMIQRIHALLGTDDLNAWEAGFVSSVWDRTNNGADTTALTEAQADKVEQIFSKHFAG